MVVESDGLVSAFGPQSRLVACWKVGGGWDLAVSSGSGALQ